MLPLSYLICQQVRYDISSFCQSFSIFWTGLTVLMTWATNLPLPHPPYLDLDFAFKFHNCSSRWFFFHSLTINIRIGDNGFTLDIVNNLDFHSYCRAPTSLLRPSFLPSQNPSSLPVSPQLEMRFPLLCLHSYWQPCKVCSCSYLLLQVILRQKHLQWCMSSWVSIAFVQKLLTCPLMIIYCISLLTHYFMVIGSGSPMSL